MADVAAGAGALAQRGAADVLGRDRAADVQTIMVAIAHVAQRNTVERETELVLVEAADRDAGRPFIGTEWVGRLEVDAGQLLDGTQRAAAGGNARDIFGADFLHLTGLTSAQHDDIAAGV